MSTDLKEVRNEAAEEIMRLHEIYTGGSEDEINRAKCRAGRNEIEQLFKKFSDAQKALQQADASFSIQNGIYKAITKAISQHCLTSQSILFSEIILVSRFYPTIPMPTSVNPISPFHRLVTSITSSLVQAANRANSRNNGYPYWGEMTTMEDIEEKPQELEEQQRASQEGASTSTAPPPVVAAPIQVDQQQETSENIGIRTNSETISPGPLIPSKLVFQIYFSKNFNYFCMKNYIRQLFDKIEINKFTDWWINSN